MGPLRLFCSSARADSLGNAPISVGNVPSRPLFSISVALMNPFLLHMLPDHSHSLVQVSQ